MNVKMLLGIYIILFHNLTSGFTQHNKVDSVNYLSPIENEIVREINVVRKNPQKYASFLEQLKPYYVGKIIKRPGKIPIRTKEGVSAVEEAINFLQSMKAVSPLSPSKGMSLAAKDHVVEQGLTGITGHEGSKGSQVWDRVNRYGTWQFTIAENIAYGRNNARDIVMGLIIDDNVPGRGHRKNIFNPEFHFVGVAYGHHVTLRTICVITFAGGYRDN